MASTAHKAASAGVQFGYGSYFSLFFQSENVYRLFTLVKRPLVLIFI